MIFRYLLYDFYNRGPVATTVKIVHYSTDVKPVNYLFMNHLPDFQDFLDEFLAARPRRCSKVVQGRIVADGLV